MNLVKIVNQYFDTDNPTFIVETEENKYYELVFKLLKDGMWIGYKEIKDTVQIGHLDFKRNADISPKDSDKDTSDGPYLRAFKKFFGTELYHTNSAIIATEDAAKQILTQVLTDKELNELIIKSA